MKSISTFCTLLFPFFSLMSHAQTFTYDFTTSSDGWSGDFADYPLTDSVFYELEFAWTTLPAPLNTSKHALKISGNNHSDDLFMFIKRKITGLLPNTTYSLLIDVEFASSAPTNAIGIGGAPGEGVTMKAGASVVEPVKVLSGDAYIMNIDKGNQSVPGVDMDTIGHVGVTDTTTVFTLISRNNTSHPFTITSDANGDLWVAIGSDSGFEGTTTLYYNEVTLSFSALTGIDDLTHVRKVMLYPNPASESITVVVDGKMIGSAYAIINQSGVVVLRGRLVSETTLVVVDRLLAGIYIMQVGEHQKQFSVIRQ